MFHRDRITAREQDTDRRGPTLPYWVGIGLNGNRDATYLAVIGCSEDAKPGTLPSGEFPRLDQELVETLGIAGSTLDRRSFNDGFETVLYGPQQTTLRRVKVDRSGARFLQVEWRIDTEPVDLATVLILAVDGVKAMRQGACASALGKRPWIGVALMHWPIGGIATDGLIAADRWSDGHHGGQSVNLFKRFRPQEDEWSFVLDFAQKMLSDAGYICHEQAVRALTEAAVRDAVRNRQEEVSKPTLSSTLDAP